MQSNNKFFSDLSKVIGGAAGGMMDAKREIEEMISNNLEKLLQKMDLVTKEEFDTAQAMLTKSRIEQEALIKRLEALENEINALSAGKKSTK